MRKRDKLHYVYRGEWPESTLSGPRRLKKESFNFLSSGGVCKSPSRITQTGHGLSFHTDRRPLMRKAQIRRLPASAGTAFRET